MSEKYKGPKRVDCDDILYYCDSCGCEFKLTEAHIKLCKLDDPRWGKCHPNCTGE